MTLDEWIADFFSGLFGSLLNFVGQRLDTPVVVKDAVHDTAIEDAFDAEVLSDATAGRVDAPGAGV